MILRNDILKTSFNVCRLTFLHRLCEITSHFLCGKDYIFAAANKPVVCHGCCKCIVR